MVYQGSKNRIAKHLLPFIMNELTADRWYVEPFCGGCNLIDKVNHPKRMANDVNKYLIALFRHVQSGGFLPDRQVVMLITRQRIIKNTIPTGWLAFLGSYARSEESFLLVIGEKRSRKTEA